MQIGNTNSYKYLGMTMNTRANLSDQITTITQKTEAAYQTTLMLAHDSNFDGIQMELIWKLLETCIIPIITYSSETWNPSKKEIKRLNSTMDNILKRILKTPITTPREALYIETGLLDPRTIMDQKRIMMQPKSSNTNLGAALNKSENKNTWNSITNKIMEEYKVTSQLPTKNAHKKYVTKKIHDCFKKRIEQESENKSKIKHLLEGRGQWSPGHRSRYLNTLTRNECSTIFKARTRMLDIKNNFRGKHDNTQCRACKKEIETQEHILNQCTAIHTDNTTKVPPNSIFTSNSKQLKLTITKINRCMEKITP